MFKRIVLGMLVIGSFGQASGADSPSIGQAQSVKAKVSFWSRMTCVLSKASDLAWRYGFAVAAELATPSEDALTGFYSFSATDEAKVQAYGRLSAGTSPWLHWNTKKGMALDVPRAIAETVATEKIVEMVGLGTEKLGHNILKCPRVLKDNKWEYTCKGYEILVRLAMENCVRGCIVKATDAALGQPYSRRQ